MQRHLTLLTEHAQIPPGSQLMISELDDSELIAQFARQHKLSIFQRDYAIASRVRDTLAKFPQITFLDRPMETAEQKYDAAILQIPKSRGFTQALLFTILRALKTGAPLYGIGPTRGGVNTALTDAQQLGPTHSIASRARHRLFVVNRPENPTAPDDWNSPWQPRAIEMHVDTESYQVMTQPGIFSWNEPDEGTAFLIHHFAQLCKTPDMRVLDAGCGCGLLAMAAQAYFSPKRLVPTDTDLLALNCARINLPAAEILPHDLSQSPLPNSQFDLILCNPPFHQAHEKDLSFMHHFPAHALKMLAPNGQLAIVANSFLPYRSLLAEHFEWVTKLNDDGRFQVLLAGALQCQPRQ